MRLFSVVSVGFLALLCSIRLAAQSYVVQLHPAALQDSGALRREIVVPPSFNNAGDAYSFLQKLVPSLQEKGFLAASVDSIAIAGNHYDGYVFLGEKYRWAKVSLDSLPVGLTLEAALHPEQWNNRPIHPKQLSRLSERILRWADENGYPFAKVGLQKARLDEQGRVEGFIRLERGPFRKLDSIQINGGLRISKSFLTRYLDLKEGEPYNERRLKTVSNRLRELPFLQEAQPWEVRFKLTQTHLNLFLEERKSNQLNAIVGLLPNYGESRSLLFTVDALFAFQNLFGNGESLSVTVQNLQPKSPRLRADVVWPYLMGTPLGAEAHFEFYQKDTTWRRTFYELGGRYQLSATDYLKLTYQGQSNRLTYVDTAAVRASGQLPDNADVSVNGANAEIAFNRTDYRLNPRKGWQIRVAGAALQRAVQRNNTVLSLSDGNRDFAALYDSLAQNKAQYRLEAEAATYFSLARQAVIKVGYRMGYLSGNGLFRNELFQIGGFRILRGFDEQSIFTNHFQMAEAELRLLLGQNSYAYLFSDNAWVQSRYNGMNSSGWYHGFGVGVTLETKSGLFSLAYAVGRSPQETVQFRRSKVHFGYVAFF